MLTTAPVTWTDPQLKRLARGRAPLPFETAEYSWRELKRRTLLLAVGSALALVIIFTALFAGVGLLSWLGPGDLIAQNPDTPPWAIPAITLGVSIAIGLLVYGLLRLRQRQLKDETDHPWRFQAGLGSFTVITAKGVSLSAPWARWSLVGYRCGQLKGSRLVWGLELELEGRQVYLEFGRLRRPRTLARVVLQSLAASGGAGDWVKGTPPKA